MTIAQGLQALNAYPLPPYIVEQICIARGLELTADINKYVVKTPEYILAEADIFRWLAQAPNVSQGGQNYSFTDAQRLDFKRQAMQRYKEQGAETELQSMKRANYGYKGSRL